MNERDSKIRFTSSDVWLLLALSYAAHRRPATLTEIVSAGDMINKAVFTAQELRRGFAKLIAGGLAEEHDLQFSLTPHGEEFLAASGPQLRSVYDRWKLIEEKLSATGDTIQDSPTYEERAWSYSAITDDLVANATQEHSDQMKQFMRVSGLLPNSPPPKG